MSKSLTSLVADPPSGRSRAVLFDHHEYAQRVILQGKGAPWAEPMAYSNFYGQAQALLTADAAQLDLGRYYTYCMERDPLVGEAMAAKPRTGYALRTLLGHPGLSQQVLDLATTFTKTQRVPVVLKVPSPMQWLAWTHQHVSAGTTAELDADDAEKAAMYVADWVRSFADLDLAAVLLDDRALLDVELASVDPGVYSPLTNVTDYYRWSLAVQHDDRVEVLGQEPVGAVLGTDFWVGGDTRVPSGDFLVTEIPAMAHPEEVMARVALL